MRIKVIEYPRPKIKDDGQERKNGDDGALHNDERGNVERALLGPPANADPAAVRGRPVDAGDPTLEFEPADEGVLGRPQNGPDDNDAERAVDQDVEKVCRTSCSVSTLDLVCRRQARDQTHRVSTD